MAFAGPWFKSRRGKLTLEVDQTAGAGRLRLNGELDERTGEAAERELRHLLAGDFDAVILDLSAVDSIDSQGVLFLIKAGRGYLGACERLRLIPPSGGARRTFDLLRLAELFGGRG